MKLRVFFTKSEYGSLILTVVFLLVISGVFWRVGPKPSSADYTVTTERTAVGVTPAAGPEELQSLPGIGEVLAARIIEYREQSGPFACPEELMAVKGIGESLFDAVSGRITTEE